MNRNSTGASALTRIGLFVCAFTLSVLPIAAVVAHAQENQEAQEQAETATATQDDALEAAMSQGRGGYLSNCSSCHGSGGEGEVGPSLVGNDLLADADLVTDTIINGYSYMPPFGDQLSDDQVAAIATYIRNAWGNEFGLVTPEDAAASR